MPMYRVRVRELMVKDHFVSVDNAEQARELVEGSPEELAEMEDHYDVAQSEWGVEEIELCKEDKRSKKK